MMSKVQYTRNIALIAHDNRKQDLCEWVEKNKLELAGQVLFATGTTGYLLEKTSGLEVQKFVTGPLGGDQQIGAKISEGAIDFLVFFWDPFEPLPHDPDVKALFRIAAAWNIPVACNVASADFMITSPLIRCDYQRDIPDYDTYIKDRINLQ